MKRRDLLLIASVGLLFPRALLAQAGTRVYRIALLDDAVESARRDNWKLFIQQLAKLGYVEGRNVSFEWRRAEGVSERLPGLAAELAALKPDVLVPTGTIASMAVKKANVIVPVVFIGVGDPTGSGLVTSLAKPGGNMTGTSVMTSEVSGKLLEVMSSVAPGAKRLAYLSDLSNKSSELSLRKLQESSARFGISLQVFDGRNREALARSLEAIRHERLQGLIVGASGVVVSFRHDIVKFVAANKLPAVYARREYIEAGGMISYGPSFQKNYVRAADLVHRVLQGANPGDQPVEQVDTFQFVINLKAAKTLGLRIPQTLLVRADEVIE